MTTIATNKKNTIKEDPIERLREAVQAKENISGLTHNFYRYPARFSPKFVREVIEVYSKPGDVILDPFVGGGTTLVEALASNRHSIGFDVSPIASFVTEAKTTLLPQNELEEVEKWAETILQKRIVGFQSQITFYDEEGYLNNLPWTIKKSIEIILNDVLLLRTIEMQNFAKCALLKTAQWAIDCRKTTPSTEDFRAKFFINVKVCGNGIVELAKTVIKSSSKEVKPHCYCINDSSENIKKYQELNELPDKPKLIITSPPYVGVHMLYHQWQVKSRKRTRTPFWIIDSLDGQGSGHYTFGYHQNHGKKKYFEIAQKVFASIKESIHDEALIVQLVGFANPKKYLEKYLQMMNSAGYSEVPIATDSLNRIKRIWRDVPNRRWYNTTKSEATSSKEVLLIHRKK